MQVVDLRFEISAPVPQGQQLSVKLPPRASLHSAGQPLLILKRCFTGVITRGGCTLLSILFNFLSSWGRLLAARTMCYLFVECVSLGVRRLFEMLLDICHCQLSGLTHALGLPPRLSITNQVGILSQQGRLLARFTVQAALPVRLELLKGTEGLSTAQTPQ
jgi:hypothetical protein